jgi:hypothetical protein
MRPRDAGASHVSHAFHTRGSDESCTFCAQYNFIAPNFFSRLRLRKIASSRPETSRGRHPFPLREGAGGRLAAGPQLPHGNIENTFSISQPLAPNPDLMILDIEMLEITGMVTVIPASDSGGRRFRGFRRCGEFDRCRATSRRRVNRGSPRRFWIPAVALGMWMCTDSDFARRRRCAPDSRSSGATDICVRSRVYRPHSSGSTEWRRLRLPGLPTPRHYPRQSPRLTRERIIPYT